MLVMSRGKWRMAVEGLAIREWREERVALRRLSYSKTNLPPQVMRMLVTVGKTCLRSESIAYWNGP